MYKLNKINFLLIISLFVFISLLAVFNLSQLSVSSDLVDAKTIVNKVVVPGSSNTKYQGNSRVIDFAPSTVKSFPVLRNSLSTVPSKRSEIDCYEQDNTDSSIAIRQDYMETSICSDPDKNVNQNICQGAVYQRDNPQGSGSVCFWNNEKRIRFNVDNTKNNYQGCFIKSLPANIQNPGNYNMNLYWSPFADSATEWWDPTLNEHNKINTMASLRYNTKINILSTNKADAVQSQTICNNIVANPNDRFDEGKSSAAVYFNFIFTNGNHSMFFQTNLYDTRWRYNDPSSAYITSDLQRCNFPTITGATTSVIDIPADILLNRALLSNNSFDIDILPHVNSWISRCRTYLTSIGKNVGAESEYRLSGMFTGHEANNYTKINYEFIAPKVTITQKASNPIVIPSCTKGSVHASFCEAGNIVDFTRTGNLVPDGATCELTKITRQVCNARQTCLSESINGQKAEPKCIDLYQSSNDNGFKTNIVRRNSGYDIDISIPSSMFNTQVGHVQFIMGIPNMTLDPKSTGISVLFPFKDLLGDGKSFVNAYYVGSSNDHRWTRFDVGTAAKDSTGTDLRIISKSLVNNNFNATLRIEDPDSNPIPGAASSWVRDWKVYLYAGGMNNENDILRVNPILKRSCNSCYGYNYNFIGVVRDSKYGANIPNIAGSNIYPLSISNSTATQNPQTCVATQQRFCSANRVMNRSTNTNCVSSETLIETCSYQCSNGACIPQPIVNNQVSNSLSFGVSPTTDPNYPAVRYLTAKISKSRFTGTPLQVQFILGAKGNNNDYLPAGNGLKGVSILYPLSTSFTVLGNPYDKYYANIGGANTIWGWKAASVSSQESIYQDNNNIRITPVNNKIRETATDYEFEFKIEMKYSSYLLGQPMKLYMFSESLVNGSVLRNSLSLPGTLKQGCASGNNCYGYLYDFIGDLPWTSQPFNYSR